MSDNLRYWSALEKTDPKHTQKFDRGRFKGTAIKPIYSELRLTETFGPCGIGWGMDKPEFQIQPANNEIVVYCVLRLWYMDDGKRGEVYGVGGDKVLAQQKNGPFVSDEAFKAAFTDALTNAMKHLGVSADVHMGRFDDHKYVAAMNREFADDEPSAPPAGARNAAPPSRAPANGHAPPATRSAPAPSPEEPPAIAKARAAEREAFWARDDYGIDPDVIQGGIGRWDAEMLAMADTAPTLDAFLKLKDDNRIFYRRWSGQVQVVVDKSFRSRMSAAEQRLERAA